MEVSSMRMSVSSIRKEVAAIRKGVAAMRGDVLSIRGGCFSFHVIPFFDTEPGFLIEKVFYLISHVMQNNILNFHDLQVVE